MKCIVAVDKNWGIGKDNNLLFRLPLDMKNFKQKTTGKVVVMGANTFNSLPNGALPNRVNIVLDHTNSVHQNATTVDCLDNLFEILKKYPADSIFVIGGAAVYALLLEFCSEVFVTKVNADGGATMFFPDLDKSKRFVLSEQSETVIDNGFETTYCVYTKK